MTNSSTSTSFDIDRVSTNNGISTNTMIVIIMSTIMFCITVVILVWFFRDFGKRSEEAEARLKLEDNKEAERNKKDPAKRKRAITATIEKKKLHVNKSKKDHIADTESTRSRSSSINTDPACNSHIWHDEECGVQHQHQALPTGSKNCSNEKIDVDDNDESESTGIINIRKPIADASTDTGHDDNEDDRDDYDNMCSICFEPFSDDQDLSRSKTNKCQHVFHSECLETWLMRHEDCPYCRTPLMTTQDFLDRTYASDNSDDEQKKMKEDGGSDNRRCTDNCSRSYIILSSDINDGGALHREQEHETNDSRDIEEGESSIQMVTSNDYDIESSIP